MRGQQHISQFPLSLLSAYCEAIELSSQMNQKSQVYTDKSTGIHSIKYIYVQTHLQFISLCALYKTVKSENKRDTILENIKMVKMSFVIVMRPSVVPSNKARSPHHIVTVGKYKMCRAFFKIKEL